jgi:retron-type reverse transcriptase
VLHHAIFRILYPIFDRTFIFDSYSCRIGKGTHRAVYRLSEFARKANKNNSRTCWFLKCDIKKFFNSVDHNILIELIEKKINCQNAIWLIGRIIGSFSTSERKGIPMGNITSQLFANIYLNELDQFVKHKLKIKYYIRYCDDFLIVENGNRKFESYISKINGFLKSNLKLVLHPDKIIVRKYHQGIDFLGYVSFPNHRVLRTKTKRRILKKIKIKLKEESFNQTLQSYFGVLKHCNSYKTKKEIFKLLK